MPSPKSESRSSYSNRKKTRHSHSTDGKRSKSPVLENLNSKDSSRKRPSEISKHISRHESHVDEKSNQKTYLHKNKKELLVGSFGKPILHPPSYDISPDRSAKRLLELSSFINRNELFEKMLEAKKSDNLDDYYRFRDLLNEFDKRNIGSCHKKSPKHGALSSGEVELEELEEVDCEETVVIECPDEEKIPKYDDNQDEDTTKSIEGLDNGRNNSTTKTLTKNEANNRAKSSHENVNFEGEELSFEFLEYTSVRDEMDRNDSSLAEKTSMSSELDLTITNHNYECKNESEYSTADPKRPKIFSNNFIITLVRAVYMSTQEPHVANSNENLKQLSEVLKYCECKQPLMNGKKNRPSTLLEISLSSFIKTIKMTFEKNR